MVEAIRHLFHENQISAPTLKKIYEYDVEPRKAGAIEVERCDGFESKTVATSIHQGSHTGQEVSFDFLSFFVPLQTLLALSKT
jgi:hypothetical protein